MKKKEQPKTSRFVFNSFYETLIKQRDLGKIDLATLSVSTRLALLEYEQQKRYAERLEQDQPSTSR